MTIARPRKDFHIHPDLGELFSLSSLPYLPAPFSPPGKPCDGSWTLGTMKENEFGSPEGLLEWSNAATFWVLGAVR